VKILFVTHRTPFPPNKGEKIRAYHILNEFRKRHTVSLLYWLDNPNDEKHVDELRKICGGPVVPVALNPGAAVARGILSLVLRRSFSEGYFYSLEFQAAFDALVREHRPDLLFVFSSTMGGYLRSHAHVRTIVDFVDVDSEKWRQLAEFKQWPFSLLCNLEHRRLARFERKLAASVGCSLFVSHSEADLFKRMGGAGQVAVIPNGVEPEVRRLPIRHLRRDCNDGPVSPKIIFVGTMNYLPNIDAVLYFVQEIWPLIRKGCTTAEFHVVGRCPPRSVRKLNGLDGICVFGEVPNIAPYLLNADVSVAPLRIARGVQNKVLEAMAIGVPVVASSQAVQGINVEPEKDILVADEPVQFARQVFRVLNDGELYQTLVSRGRTRVVEGYSWNRIGAELEQIIAELTRPATSEFTQLQPAY
jgi:sugar transferase (PEP-CTERM/EpsH1 system associated)